jgi:hypothetical protein
MSGATCLHNENVRKYKLSSTYCRAGAARNRIILVEPELKRDEATAAPNVIFNMDSFQKMHKLYNFIVFSFEFTKIFITQNQKKKNVRPYVNFYSF